MDDGRAAMLACDADAEELFDEARRLVPEIRGRAHRMERAGRLDEDLVDALDDAGLFSILVPKRWGGKGLGPLEVSAVAEILGGADMSTAWVSVFYMMHNWFICRFPLEVQEQVYAGRNSVRCAAVWNPPGKAERVPGGHRLTGTWGYASGIVHAHYLIAPAVVDDIPHWFLLPREAVQVIDDWDMGAMRATGSLTATVENLFVAESWALPIETIVSAKAGEAAIHPESVYRYSFGALGASIASACLGGLGTAINIARDRLFTSKPYGIARSDREPSRIRWAHAYQFSRAARAVRDATIREMIRVEEAGAAKPPADAEAAFGLDNIFITQGAMEAARSLLDGGGTSGYAANNPVRRISGDLAMIATHILSNDYDVLMERHARRILGVSRTSKRS